MNEELLSHAVAGNWLGKELCQVLNLQNRRVTRLQLDCILNEVATLTITQQVRADEVDELVNVISKYELAGKQT